MNMYHAYASLSTLVLPRSSLFSAPGRSVETVPCSLAVSATPSPFLLFSECSEIGEVCSVLSLDKPFCLPDVSLVLLVSSLRGSAYTR